MSYQDESEIIRNDRDEARTEAMRHSPTRRERLYGEDAPDATELATEAYWDAMQEAREEREWLRARHDEWYSGDAS